MSEIWPSPAKINLFLHIIGRRADGYHNLQTIFQFLDYGDELSFKLRSDDKIELTTSSPELATENNLILRAAHLLRRNGLGVAIHLEKHLPIGGGLGGGSSNAATTLVALNKLWHLDLSSAELLSYGLQLGADVPIFINAKAAWAEGVGEQFTPITIAEPWYVVLVPPHPVSTAEFFSADELTRNTRPITIREFLDGSATRNDFEPLARKRYPMVALALDWLNQSAPARLTGSGGCVFAAMSTEQEAQAIAAQAPKPLSAFIAKGLNTSPLLNVSS